ncbi:hypothetical protein DAI22_01g452400 [Oryza sativa Japonica Group]|nr:hypothetical protein DAI22_01g452400 [Oryza sativa Japonica Group]
MPSSTQFRRQPLFRRTTRGAGCSRCFLLASACHRSGHFVEKKLLDEIDINTIINDFASRNGRRKF